MRSTLTHALRSATLDWPDGQLLDLFARHRDEDAFAAVVRRHGPMVLGVCRRLLGNRADADDAFQATFLVLARKAAALGHRDALAGFLHGVAVNAARKLRHMNAKRKAREHRALGPTSALPADDLLRDELLAALDDEISRLPAMYRSAIVLCDLEGATRKEAARRLGCPEGTVAGRLARARALLAARLTDRGLVFAGGALMGLTTAVSPTLLASALEAATAGPTSARVAAATEGVMKAMLLNKIRAATALLVLGAIAITGVGLSRGPAEEKPEPVVAPPAAAPAKPADRRVTVFPLKKLKCAEAAATLTKALATWYGENAPGDTDRLIESMLKRSDRNADGLIDRDEVSDRLKSVFERFDANKDGHLDSSEFRAYMQDRLATSGNSALGTARPAGSAMVIPIEAENTLIVYADEPTTREIETLLRKLGEPPPKTAALVPLRNVSAAEAAKVLSEVFGRDRATVVPIPGEEALIVYASETDLRTARQLIGQAIDAPAAKPVPVPPPVPTAKPVPAPQRFALALQDQTWGEVFAWYERVSGLKCLSTVKPPGTFTYITPPGVTYSVAEITDVLNDALMARKFIMIRREQSFSAYPADEKLPADAVPHVAANELDRRARTELVKVLLPLTSSAEFNDVLVQLLKQQLGPFGAVEASGPKHIFVTETAGRARAVRDLLADLNTRPGQRDVLTIQLRNVAAGDVAEALKKHVHPGQKFAVTFDAPSNTVVIEGDPVLIAMARDMIRKLDTPPPLLTVLPLKHASAQVVAQKLNTPFGKADQYLVMTDRTTNSLVVQANPIELQKIKDLLRTLDVPSSETQEKLAAEVVLLKDEVAFAERMVKRGFLHEREAQAARDRLKAAEAKLKDGR